MTGLLAIDLASEAATVPYLWAAGLLAIPLALGLLVGMMSSTSNGKFLSGFAGGAGTATLVRWCGRFAFTLAALVSLVNCVEDRGAMSLLGAVIWQIVAAAVVLFCNLFRVGVRATVVATMQPVLAVAAAGGFVAAAAVSATTHWQLSLLVLAAVTIYGTATVPADELAEEEKGLLFFGRW